MFFVVCFDCNKADEFIVIFSDKVSRYEHNKGGKKVFEALSVHVRFITL